MKNSILLLISIFLFIQLSAQKCLDLNIATLMGKLEAPGDAASSFHKCNTVKNDHHQIVITNYGSDLVSLDTLEAQTGRDFNYAVLAGSGFSSAQAPSGQDIDAIKADAEKLKSMSADQQKAYAMQMAQKYNTTGAKPIQDDPAIVQLVMQTQNIAVNQMKALDDEFAAKILALNQSASGEIKAIPLGDKSKCPTDKVGLVACGCANEVEGAYWKKVVSVQDKYNDQKTALYQSYLPRIKALAGKVDDAVVKSKYGDALQSADMKRMLLSSQSSAYANAFIETTLCIEGVRKSGADVYVNKANSDGGVYDLSCSGGK